MTTAIRVDNLGKRYTITSGSQRADYRTLRESVSSLASSLPNVWRTRPIRRPRTEEFWALRDVDFEVHSGAVLGVIGRNGAGKSTLLKVLSRITKPTTGEVRLRGRVGSLLEVGTGFHPELSGRENIYLNGAILGMHRREIDCKFDEIVAFAGVDQFLDTPIKRYSSGMYVRLAFAVAAHLEPEILIVDEVLAVGDQAFQRKCTGRMGEIAASGRTVLLVSHDLSMLAKLCTKAIWLDQGRVRETGLPIELIARYCADAARSGGSAAHVSLVEHHGRRRGMIPMLRSAAIRDESGNLATTVSLGGSFMIEFEIADLPGRSDHTLIVDICDVFGSVLARAHSQVHSWIDLTGVSHATVKCLIDDVRLLPGEYTVTLAIGDSTLNLDRVENAIAFTITPADVYGTGKIPPRRFGMIAIAARFELERKACASENGTISGKGKVRSLSTDRCDQESVFPRQ